jgi:hypothetical protein
VCLYFLGLYFSLNRQDMKLVRVRVCFVRSILQCEQTGYEAGWCVCILLVRYFSVDRQDMKLDRVYLLC